MPCPEAVATVFPIGYAPALWIQESSDPSAAQLNDIFADSPHVRVVVAPCGAYVLRNQVGWLWLMGILKSSLVSQLFDTQNCFIAKWWERFVDGQVGRLID